MFYRLSASMSDRMNFDSFAQECGYEAATLDMTAEDAAESCWETAVDADQIGLVENYESPEDADLFPCAVDDLQEARARWMSSFPVGFKVKLQELEDVC